MDSTKVLYEANPSMFRNAPFFFIFLLVLVPFIVGIFFFLIWWLQCIGTKITVTESKTILRRGILSKRLIEVRNSDVRAVTLDQSLFQRMFGTGNISVATAGHAGVEISISGIPSPEKAKAAIEACGKGNQ